MPPKKEKASKPGSSDDPEQKVLEALQKRNAPTNATDLTGFLKGFSKATVTKALASLAEKDLILAKTYGKQIIYSIKQTDSMSLSPEEMEELKKAKEAEMARNAELKLDVARLRNEVKELESSPKTEDLHRMISELQQENQNLSAHLANLRSKPELLISKEDIKKVDENLAYALKEWRFRRKIGKETLGIVQDALGMSNTAAWEWFTETMGLEGDHPALEKLEKEGKLPK